MHSSAIAVSLLVGILCLCSCTREPVGTPTRGNLHVLVDESIAPPVIHEIDQFMAYYRQNGANVTYALLPSEKAIQRFVHDTIRTVFVTRMLTSAERQEIEKSYGKFLEMTVAYDAVGVVVHLSNPVDGITVDNIRRILEGRIKRWEELKTAKKMKGNIHVYLQDSSDVSAYLSTRLLNRARPAVKLLTQQSSSDLLRNVKKDPAALGFVGVGWIDSAKASVKVLEVSASSADSDSSFLPPTGSVGKSFPPHAAYIHQNAYPFKRAVFMYSKSLGGDLAAGFSSFVATFEGQRIFLSHGLVPGTQEVVLRKTR